MSEDKGVLQLSGEPEIQATGEESGLSPNLPYYWSWYRLVFPDHDQGPGETGIPLQPERN